MATENSEALSPVQEAVAAIVADPPKETPALADPPETGGEEAPKDGAGAQGEGEKPKPKAKPKIEPWVQARLDEKTFKQRQAERERDEAVRRAEAAEAMAAEALRKAPAGEGEHPAPTPAKPAAGYVPQDQVEARATQIASDKAFSEETHRVFNAGIAEFSDFRDALGPLQEMGATDRRDFLEAAFATGEAHKVLHHLGSNPNEASDLLKLSPVRMAAAMAKIAASAEPATKAKGAPPPSNAPRPATPVGGTARSAFDPYDKGSSMDDFSAWFDKELGPKILRRQ